MWKGTLIATPKRVEQVTLCAAALWVSASLASDAASVAISTWDKGTEPTRPAYVRHAKTC